MSIKENIPTTNNFEACHIHVNSKLSLNRPKLLYLKFIGGRGNKNKIVATNLKNG